MREHPFDEKLKVGYQGDALEQLQIPSVIERFRADPRYHIWIGVHGALGGCQEFCV
jgi:hypothetical protein